MTATIFTPASSSLRSALIASVALGAAVFSTTEAGAVSSSVRFACAGDYLANCSSYAPNSPETRRCMRKVGYRLSKRCINALVAAGEVSQAEVSSKAASRR
jgi:hypothetical protein